MIVQEYQVSFFDSLIMMHETQDSEVSILLSPEYLPEIGFIAFEGSNPISAGFLRRVEGGFAQIDTLVTNADFDKNTRNQGLSAVVSVLIKTAKDLNLNGLMFLTSEESIIERAKELGFHYVNQVVMAKAL